MMVLVIQTLVRSPLYWGALVIVTVLGIVLMQPVQNFDFTIPPPACYTLNAGLSICN